MNSLRQSLDINPTRLFAALNGFGAALVAVLALMWSWQPELVVGVQVLVTAAINVPASLFRSVSTTALETLDPNKP